MNEWLFVCYTSSRLSPNPIVIRVQTVVIYEFIKEFFVVLVGVVSVCS